MAQIPYIAIDEYVNNLSIDDEKHFHGTGSLVVPFTMIDISNEQHFSWLAENEHAFCSWLPLYDNKYWLFVCRGILIADKETLYPDRINLYGQNMPLTTSNDFEFYYSITKRPFNFNNVSITKTAYPYTYNSRQARTGVIKNVNLVDFRDQTGLIAIDDQNGYYMDDSQTDDLIRLNMCEQAGTNYM